MSLHPALPRRQRIAATGPAGPCLSARRSVPASPDKSSGLCHGLRSDVMVWVSIIVVRTSLWPSIC
jgi:hypothetical protein